MIQWYPGHMAKAKKEIEENLKLVDIIFELVDARIPISSRNPVINVILKNKPRLVIITKANMADEYWNNRFIEYFKKEQCEALLVDSISGFNIHKIVNMSRLVLQDKLAKEKERGMKDRPLKAMVIGIPNVGKSTLINKLVGKKITLVGNKPGVTKAQQWIKINNNLALLDTPGVLWPKFEDPIVAYNLALTGAIRDEVIRKGEVINYFIDFLKNNYASNLVNYCRVNQNDDLTNILDKIAVNKGLIQNKEIDYERVYDAIINDYRNQKIGRITLDVWKNE